MYKISIEVIKFIEESMKDWEQLPETIQTAQVSTEQK